ncbi:MULTISPECIES: PAS domain-containing sensor histidine kinase [unclassified Thioalkalivibrio]|uniref:sensor histidine kinase n=1 Tax=unclassified Thioalkalivibrio TaxID=2621013 RepID=UPI000375D471|nr:MULTISPECIES: histidine kinase dimerization/phospho-acceptor domain-containing protein [unclassified Thioalkalivibrio]
MVIDSDTQRSSRLYALYRVFVALVLLLMGLFPGLPVGVAPAVPEVYPALAGGYLVFSVFMATFAEHCNREPERVVQFRRMILLGGTGDAAGLLALMVVAGGVHTGIGLLLIPAVMATALLSAGRLGLPLAAAVTAGLLGAEGLAILITLGDLDSLTQAGLLGAALLAGTLLAHHFSRRADESRAQVEQQEVDLASLAELNAQIIARMSAGVVAIDPRGYIRSINEAARQLLPPRPGRHLSSISPRLARAVREWQEETGPASRTRHLPGDQEQPALQVRLAPLGNQGDQGTLLILEDAAELRRQAQASKLQALGRLTASIAHEIRNPLGAISHSAQLLRESPDLSAPDQRLLAIIDKQSDRVNSLIANVLSLSRRESGERQRLNLRDELERFAEEFCSALQIPRESLHVNVEPADSVVLFDPSQLNQVLWNLCGNARVHGGHDRPDSPPIILRGGSGQVARVVSLDVLDAGPGIDPETEKELFEPFVSGHSGGSGLGLYISRMLCENNGASLEYAHAPSGGCFRILFAPDEQHQGSAS